MVNGINSAFNNMQPAPNSQLVIVPSEKKRSAKETVYEKAGEAALGTFVPFRRIASLPDKINQGDVFGAIGLTSLMIINLPEDMRDVKSAYNQIAHSGTFKPSYNTVKYQHDFSFFKGTLLQDYMDNCIKSEKGKAAVKKWYESDKSLYNSKFGSLVKKALNITDKVADNADQTWTDGLNIGRKLTEVKAPNAFARMTGRAMKRVTVYGLAAMAILEIPKIIKAFSKKGNSEEKLKEGVKQTAKSGINVATVLTGIAYGGAIGASKFGIFGSLAGMGVGAMLGSTASGFLQKQVDKIGQSDNKK